MATPLRLGTRGSALARWQAEWVAGRLIEAGTPVELIPIVTRGDQDQGPIGPASAPGLFTKELQRALLDDRIDLAVHSLKDLPTDPVPGLQLAAVPPREAVGDALICRQAGSLDDLPSAAIVGTGSLRRQAQLLHARPDLRVSGLRGNVDTRLRKLREGQFDAIVLAEAGLRRLGLEGEITCVLPMAVMLPAVGQGALGLETRADDGRAREAVAVLNDGATHAAVVAERTLLAALLGGCLAPIAAWGRIDAGRLRLTGRVLARDGREQVEATAEAAPADAAELGLRVAAELRAQGALRLIEAARGPL